MTCDPSSTTRFEGILKNAVMLVALRNIAEKSPQTAAVDLAAALGDERTERAQAEQIVEMFAAMGAQAAPAVPR